MKKLVLSSAISMLISQAALAADVIVVGNIPTVVESNAPQSLATGHHKPKPNIVLLQKVKLSESAKKALTNRVHNIKHHKSSALTSKSSDLPSELDLGMNNTPVLNQGMHGSCVTFANGGALDALIGEGDYVSELCSLTLGNYLEQQDSEYPSGWEGSWGPFVLNQFFEYGIVPMETQEGQGCGGLYDYPTWDPSQTGDITTPEDYRNMSESIKEKYDWTPILNVEEAFKAGYNADDVVSSVKESLNQGNRVTFGVLLDVYYGSNGAVGSYKARKDTWMLTPEIEEDAENDQIDAGHEMIITGYDDNAVVRSPNGVENKGLFILRNSWGSFAGDHGNYYMTYDHFKLLTLEAQSLSKK